MRWDKTGKVVENFYVVGHPVMPVYLLDGEAPLLFDAGLRALGPRYEKGIKAILKDKMPEMLLLTHSHFDHLGAAGYLKEIWPQMKIAGSQKVQDILHRQRAVETIRSLNREAAGQIQTLGISSIDETPFEPFDLDVILEPGLILTPDPHTRVACIHSPGHTWDFMSYWISQKRILVASEAVGCDDGTGYICPEFLVDYDAYCHSLTRLSTLNPRVLCPGHGMVLTDADAENHMARALGYAREYVSMVEGFLKAEAGDIEQTVMRVKEREWDPKSGPKQIESAYLLNTRVRVRCLKERMGASAPWSSG